MSLLAVETAPKGSCDSCRPGGPKYPGNRKTVEGVRDTRGPRAKDRHSLSEVDSNTRQCAREEHEKDHEEGGAGYSPYGGEQ
jgi:hypothetical protein